MHIFRQVTVNTLYQVFSRVTSSGTSFLITILIARMFNISGYGDFAKVTAFVSIFYLLVDLGFNAVFLQQDNTRLRFWDLLLLRTLSATILFFLIAFITYILPYNTLSGIGYSLTDKWYILLFSFTLFAQAIIYSTNAMLQKHLAYKYQFISTAVGSIVTLLLVFFFTLFTHSLSGLFIAYIVGMFTQAIVSLFFSKYFYEFRGFSKQFIKTVLHDTFPITLMLLFNLIYFRIDMIILSFYRSSVDVALYSVAYSVFDFLIALPLFLSNSLYPHLIQSEKNNRMAKQKERKYYSLFIFLGIDVAVIFWFIAPTIFTLIHPSLYPAVNPFRVFLLALPVFFLTSIMQWVLLAKKHQSFLAIIYAIFMVINILLNIIFIPRFGYMASAIITGICECFVALALFFKIIL